ncbi:MAG TPA: hypothetical protein PLO55_12835, partial [Thermotogota bacterium]|nr:hypothetical protein [Thermotogota bacterium]
ANANRTLKANFVIPDPNKPKIYLEKVEPAPTGEREDDYQLLVKTDRAFVVGDNFTVQLLSETIDLSDDTICTFNPVYDVDMSSERSELIIPRVTLGVPIIEDIDDDYTILYLEADTHLVLTDDIVFSIAFSGTPSGLIRLTVVGNTGEGADEVTIDLDRDEVTF